MDERSPYATPTSKLMESDGGNSVGGSVEQAIAGEISWDIGSLLSEGWEKSKGFKGVFWLALAMYMLVAVALVGVELAATKVLGGQENAALIAGVMALVRQALMLPMAAGLFVLAIRRAANLPLSASILFAYFNRLFGLFFLNIVMMLLIMLGFVLLLLPGIYLMVAYMLAMPLLVEKNMGIWEALETSRKAMTHGWFRFFALMLVSMLVATVAIIPLGIGLIWALPMLSVTYGLLYVKLFGISAHG